MSKYSITNECLDAIDNYEEQSFIAEMSVLTSLLDAYDRAITIMEYTKDDYAVQSLQMFQESSFFMEQDPLQQNQPAQQDGQPAADSGNADVKKDDSTVDTKTTTNSGMTEDQRKEHNKEHWIRQTNKKGKVENIFVSILLFIPRFFMFIGRCIGKLVKKIFGKKDNATVSATAKQIDNMTAEEKAKADETLANSNPDGSASSDSTGSNTAPTSANSTQPPNANPTPIQNGTAQTDPVISVTNNSAKYIDHAALIPALNDIEALVNMIKGFIDLYITNANWSGKYNEIRNKVPSVISGLDNVVKKTTDVPLSNVPGINDQVKNICVQISKSCTEASNSAEKLITLSRSAGKETSTPSKFKDLVGWLKSIATSINNGSNAITTSFSNIVNNCNRLLNDPTFSNKQSESQPNNQQGGES